MPKQIPIKYNQTSKRTAAALEVGLTTVQRILKDVRETGAVQPSKKSKTGRRSIVLDSFDEGVIRRAVLTMYSNKTFPTLDSLHATLKEDERFPRMSKQSLWRCCKKQLKFKFGKFQDKPVVMEREDITAHRQRYLLTIKKYRRENYNVSKCTHMKYVLFLRKNRKLLLFVN